MSSALGSKNRFTRIREDFLDAFYSDRIGGVNGLINWVLEDPKNKETFYRMIVQMLPKELNLSGREGGPIELSDPERITKLHFVIATLERMAKRTVEASVVATPEIPLVDAPQEKIEYEQRPHQDRVSNLINFVKRIEGVKVA